MDLFNVIPKGKENKETRETLMYKSHISDVKVFKKKLAELREEHIIAFDNGYYIPETKEEYMEFIMKQNKQLINTQKIMKLAYEKMKEM